MNFDKESKSEEKIIFFGMGRVGGGGGGGVGMVENGGTLKPKQ